MSSVEKDYTISSETLDDVLNLAIESNASDLHLNAGEPFLFRIGSDIRRTDNSPILTKQDLDAILYPLIGKKKDIFEKTHEIDFSYESEKISDARFRVNVGMEKNRLFATFRVIPYKIREVEYIGFPDGQTWRDIISLSKGLVLVTGVTGSGKSTTLASLIQEMNTKNNEYTICIEDPIEYVHKNRNSVIVQREVGIDTDSFFTGVKWALRQDPDNILIGEIRDTETARAALNAAETGHLVFSTLHTKDAVGTIRRYVDLFPGGEQNEIRNTLSDNLAYVISQQLIPYEQRENRVLAMEIMKNNFAIKNLIREGKMHQIQGMIETGYKERMVTMDRHLERLYKENRITRETAIFYASNRQELENKLSED